MSSKYYTDDNFTKAEKNKNPVGTGMYYIADRKASSITLKPNVSWWKKQELAIDNIQVNVYQTMNEELEAFKDGNVDMITSSFADDVFGKMVVLIGFSRFNSSYRIVNANNYVMAIIDKAIGLRQKELFS